MRMDSAMLSLALVMAAMILVMSKLTSVLFRLITFMDLLLISSVNCLDTDLYFSIAYIVMLDHSSTQDMGLHSRKYHICKIFSRTPGKAHSTYSRRNAGVCPL